MRIRQPKSFVAVYLILITDCLLFGAAARGQSIWNGGGGDDFWQTAANWNTPPIGGANLTFTGTSILTASNNSPSLSIGDINFDSSAGTFTLAGSAINLDGGIFDSSANDQVISLASTLSASQTVVNVAGSGQLTITGTVSGTGINKTGSGTLLLSGINNYTGITTISAGTLKLGSATALGTVAGGTVVNAAATLDLNGIAPNNVEQFNIQGTGVGGNGAIVNSGADAVGGISRLTLDADATVGGTGRWNISSNSPTLTLGGHTLTKIGGNQISITGATVGNGNIVVNQGTLSIELTTTVSGGVGAGTLTYDAGSTAQFVQTAAASVTRDMVFNGVVVSNGNASGAGIVDSNVAFGGDNVFSVGNGPLTFTGKITQDGSSRALVKTGNDTLTLTNANGGGTGYTGNTVIKTGTLALSFSSAGAPTSNIINATSALILGGSRGGYDSFLRVGSVVGGVLSATGKASTANSQTFNGTTIDVGYTRVSATSGSGGSMTVALGPLSHMVGGTVNFTKPAVGNITTTTANDASGILGGWATFGNTAIAASVVGSDWAANDGAGNIVAYTGYNSISGAPAFISGATTNLKWNASSGNATLAGPGTTDINSLLYADTGDAARTLDIGSGKQLRLGSTGAFFKTDTTNANNPALTIGASTGVAGGVLTAGGSISGNPGQLNIISNGNSQTAGGITINSVIADNGAAGTVTLVKNGPSLLTLNGDNSYTGDTHINMGRVDAATGTAFGSGTNATIYVQPGGQANLTAPAVYDYNFVISLGGTNAEITGALHLGNASAVVPANRTVTLVGNSVIAGRGTVAARITGDGVLDVGVPSGSAAGGGTSITIGNHSNNWTGNTTFASNVANSSTLIRLGASEVIPDGAGKGNVTLVGPSFASTTTTTWDLNSFSETINGLSSSGAPALSFIQNGANGTMSVLTIGGNDQSSTFSGILRDNGGGTASGMVAIAKTGSGEVILSGANTYTGGSTVTAGRLRANGSIAAPVSISGTTSTSSTTITGLSSTSGLLVGQPISGIGITDGAVVVTILSASSVAISSIPTIAATNTFSFSATSPIGFGDVTVSSGAQAYLNFAGTVTNNFFIAGDGITENVVGEFAPQNGALVMPFNGTTVAGSSTVTLTGNARITARGANSTGATIAGKITGAFNLELGNSGASPGIIYLSNSTNDWSGDTLIGSGTVLLGAPGGAIPNGAGKGNLIVHGDNVYASDSIFDLNGYNESINGLTSTGVPWRAKVTNTGGAAVTLFVGDNNATATFAGSIQAGASSLGLTKIGTGKQTLSGDNTYTGPTLVNNGVLNIRSGLGLGSTANGTTVALGAALELQDNVSVGNESLVLSGSGVSALGALRSVSGTNSWAGGVTLAADTSVGVDADALTVGGIVTGNYSLTKVGVGTLNLNTTNSYTGSTVVQNGTLSLNAAQTMTDLELDGASATTRTNNADSNTQSFEITTNGGTIQHNDRTLTIQGGPAASFNWASGAVLTVDGGSGGGKLVFSANQGSASVADNTAQIIVHPGATLELAGSVSATSSGSNFVNIQNDSLTTLHVTGTNQAVGNIDGVGNMTVDANMSLTASRIVQNKLLINGNMDNPSALVKIRRSINTDGPPSAPATGLDTQVSVVNSLSVASDLAPITPPPPGGYGGPIRTYYSTLDLVNNDMIITGGSQSLMGEIQDAVRAGLYTGGTSGITSSEALVTGDFAGVTYLATVLNGYDDDGNPFTPDIPLFSDFDGVTLGVDEILMKYTWFGDANLDGMVTNDDASLYTTGFFNSDPVNQAINPWFFGDFDYNGVINTDDASLYTTGFFNGGTVTQLPEPGGLVLMASAAAALIPAARRRAAVRVTCGRS